LLASIECSAQFTFVFAADVEMHTHTALVHFFSVPEYCVALAIVFPENPKLLTLGTLATLHTLFTVEVRSKIAFTLEIILLYDKISFHTKTFRIL